MDENVLKKKKIVLEHRYPKKLYHIQNLYRKFEGFGSMVPGFSTLAGKGLVP